MFLRLLIIITIVLVAAAALSRLSPSTDTSQNALSKGLGVVHSWFSEEEASGDDSGKQLTTVYKWQDADGTWQFSNEPPPPGVAGSVKVYRSDTNVTRSVKPSQSSGDSTKTPSPGPADALAPITHPDKVRQLIDDARNVQQQAEQREQELQQ